MFLSIEYQVKCCKLCIVAAAERKYRASRSSHSSVHFVHGNYELYLTAKGRKKWEKRRIMLVRTTSARREPRASGIVCCFASRRVSASQRSHSVDHFSARSDSPPKSETPSDSFRSGRGSSAAAATPNVIFFFSLMFSSLLRPRPRQPWYVYVSSSPSYRYRFASFLSLSRPLFCLSLTCDVERIYTSGARRWQGRTLIDELRCRSCL